MGQEKEVVTISKSTVAFVTVFILIMSTIFSATAYLVTAKSDINYLQKEVKSNSQRLERLETIVTTNSKHIAVVEEHYKNIDKNIAEIKKRLSKLE